MIGYFVLALFLVALRPVDSMIHKYNMVANQPGNTLLQYSFVYNNHAYALQSPPISETGGSYALNKYNYQGELVSSLPFAVSCSEPYCTGVFMFGFRGKSPSGIDFVTVGLAINSDSSSGYESWYLVNINLVDFVVLQIQQQPSNIQPGFGLVPVSDHEAFFSYTMPQATLVFADLFKLTTTYTIPFPQFSTLLPYLGVWSQNILTMSAFNLTGFTPATWQFSPPSNNFATVVGPGFFFPTGQFSPSANLFFNLQYNYSVASLVAWKVAPGAITPVWTTFLTDEFMGFSVVSSPNYIFASALLPGSLSSTTLYQLSNSGKVLHSVPFGADDKRAIFSGYNGAPQQVNIDESAGIYVDIANDYDSSYLLIVEFD